MSDTAKLIEQSVAQTFADPQLSAARLSESGFALALVPEEQGGMGLSTVDTLPILRGIGQFHVGLPLADTLIAAPVLAAAGIALQDVVVAIAFTEEPLAASFSGVLSNVAWGAEARYVLVESSQAQGLLLLDRHASGVAVRAQATPGQTVPPEPLSAIDCQAAAGQLLQNPYPVRLLEMVAWARSAQLAGAIDAAHALTVRYAQERSQFGKRLASFQAIAHQLAEAAGEAAMARIAVEVAAHALEVAAHAVVKAGAAEQARFHIACAKIVAGEAATKVAAMCHQVHGAIGYTEEYALHRFTTRLWAWRREAGSEASWAARLGRAAIAGGGAGFWPQLTAGSFSL